MKRKRVMILWAGHHRNGWIGITVGVENTLIGPLVKVEFPNGEDGLYEHRRLGEVHLASKPKYDNA